MLVKSYAKINLYLKIGKRLKNNYHNIESLMLPIKLHDDISFEKIDDNSIIIESSNKGLENEDNLSYRAALLLKNKFDINSGIKINITKNIPLAAGLGGGSSNAAATLIALNKLWKLKLNQKKLLNLAMEIGSDVPFFISGKSSIIIGIGNKIKPLKNKSLNVVLVNPGINISTAWAYKEFDKNKKKSKINNKAKNIKELVKSMRKKDIKKISENIHNDFSRIVEKKHKIINDIKSDLKKNGALSSMVSGSGPTVFGIFNSIYEARGAYYKIKDEYPFVFLTKTF